MNARQPDADLLLVTVSAEVAGHLTVALQQHRKWGRQVGLGMPEEIDVIEKTLAARARRGQAGTPLEDLWQVLESGHVSLRLVSYATAATMLQVGGRTVKRLISAGDLTPIHIGTSARLRICDIDHYIERLAANNNRRTPA